MDAPTSYNKDSPEVLGAIQKTLDKILEQTEGQKDLDRRVTKLENEVKDIDEIRCDVKGTHELVNTINSKLDTFIATTEIQVSDVRKDVDEIQKLPLSESINKVNQHDELIRKVTGWIIGSFTVLITMVVGLAAVVIKLLF